MPHTSWPTHPGPTCAVVPSALGLSLPFPCCALHGRGQSPGFNNWLPLPNALVRMPLSNLVLGVFWSPQSAITAFLVLEGLTLASSGYSQYPYYPCNGGLKDSVTVVGGQPALSCVWTRAPPPLSCVAEGISPGCESQPPGSLPGAPTVAPCPHAQQDRPRCSSQPVGSPRAAALAINQRGVWMGGADVINMSAASLRTRTL